MRTLLDAFTRPEDLTKFTLRFFDSYVQKQRQPHCENMRYRTETGEDAQECGATADGFDSVYGWLCRTCAEQLEVKFAEA